MHLPKNIFLLKRKLTFIIIAPYVIIISFLRGGMLLRGFYESAIRSSTIRTFAANYVCLNRSFQDKSFLLLVKFRYITGSNPFVRSLSFSTNNGETFESRSRNGSPQNCTNNMDRILNVAEKNDAAKSLAEIMSRGRYRKVTTY